MSTASGYPFETANPLEFHQAPQDLSDRVALGMTRALRFFADRLFRQALWPPRRRAGNRSGCARNGRRNVGPYAQHPPHGR